MASKKASAIRQKRNYHNRRAKHFKNLYQRNVGNIDKADKYYQKASYHMEMESYYWSLYFNLTGKKL